MMIPRREFEVGVLLFFIQLFCTYAMTGIIWFVQLVHYPLFDRVASDRWMEFHRAHSTRITWIVAPLMLLELVAAIYFYVSPAGIMNRSEKEIAAVLVIFIWLSTFALQVPQHNRLAKGFLADAHRRLVVTNWVRTIAWSARSVIVTIWICRLAIRTVA
jgi:hypothetical protein